ncbi:MAG: TetR/AcrR family transcriptional regulator [Acidimicrobiales bacterium]|nr:TetR/AcrR family transcriptional regulator [Acidimicrobiales bacterium]
MSADTPDLILDAVQSVIVRDGVRGASMRNVAEEADVSVGLLSYHFDDKDSLILAAFDRSTERLLAASVEAAAAVDAPEAKVRAFLRGSYTREFLDGDYLRLRISLWAVAVTDPAVAALDQEFYRTYSDAWRQLIAAARPDLSAEDLRSRMVTAIAASNGIWLDWARFADAAALERGLIEVESMVLG